MTLRKAGKMLLKPDPDQARTQLDEQASVLTRNRTRPGNGCARSPWN